MTLQTFLKDFHQYALIQTSMQHPKVYILLIGFFSYSIAAVRNHIWICSIFLLLCLYLSFINTSWHIIRNKYLCFSTISLYNAMVIYRADSSTASQSLEEVWTSRMSQLSSWCSKSDLYHGLSTYASELIVAKRNKSTNKCQTSSVIDIFSLSLASDNCVLIRLNTLLTVCGADWFCWPVWFQRALWRKELEQELLLDQLLYKMKVSWGSWGLSMYVFV